jgi:hypothetical protein
VCRELEGFLGIVAPFPDQLATPTWQQLIYMSLRTGQMLPEITYAMVKTLNERRMKGLDGSGGRLNGFGVGASTRSRPGADLPAARGLH